MTCAPSPEELIEMYAEGTLALALAHRFDLNDATLVDATKQACTQLHNAGTIDLLQLITAGHITALGPLDSMYAIDHLCDLLPNLELSPDRILEALEGLAASAEFGGLAYKLQVAYRNWCGQNASYTRDIIEAALAGAPRARKYLVLALEATQNLDLAREIAGIADESLRVAAIAVLGTLEDRNPTSRAATCRLFESLVTQAPESTMRASVLRAWTNMIKRGVPEAQAHALSLLRQILIPPDDAVLHDAAYLLWTCSKNLSDDAVIQLCDALKSVQTAQPATLNLLDLACGAMLETGRHTQAIAFVTNMVTRAEDPLPFSIFTNFSQALTNGATPGLSQAVVSWFLLGDPRLCNGLLHALPVEKMEGSPIDLRAEDLAISPTEQLFLCRKSIGWFFTKPVTAASILISILRISNNEAASAIQHLLADLLLLNYSRVREYLLNLPPEDQVRVAPALAKHDAYQAGLEKVPFIVELQPSEHQRRIERLRAGELMRETRQQAQKQSIFAQLVHRSVLLYGNRSLSYVKSPDGAFKPFDMKLSSIGVSYEIPSMQYVDPVGLDYQLLMYRQERLQP